MVEMKNKSLYILRYLVHGVHVMWLLGYHTLSYPAHPVALPARLCAEVTDLQQDATERQARGGVCSVNAYIAKRHLCLLCCD